MDIFRSKEVYRKVKKRDDVNTQDPIIPVRGMYVVGQYLVPEYKGSGIEVTGIYTTRPRIVDFTERSETVASDHTVQLLDFKIKPNTPTVTRYSVLTAPDQYDHTTRLLDFKLRPSLSYTRYTRKYDEEPADHTVRLQDFKLKDRSISLQSYYHIKLDNIPEPTVIIRDLKTGNVTITDD